MDPDHLRDLEDSQKLKTFIRTVKYIQVNYIITLIEQSNRDMSSQLNVSTEASQVNS